MIRASTLWTTAPVRHSFDNVNNIVNTVILLQKMCDADQLPFRLSGMTYQELLDEIETVDAQSLPSGTESDNDVEEDIEEISDVNPVLSSDSDSDNEPLAALQNRLKQSANLIPQPPIWGTLERPDAPSPFTEVSGVPEDIKNSNPTPFSLFRLFFDEHFIDKLVFETNLYAEQHQMQSGKTYTKTTAKEMNAFLGINLLMGIKRLPSYKDYWSSAPDLHDSYISSIMSVKRFGWLLAHLHLNDNSLMPKRDAPDFDRLYKVRPLLQHLEKAFKTVILPSEVLAIDESMIKFKGRSFLKQYMPKKPIKRGYKVWMLCDKSGYCLKFEIYSGKSTEGSVEKSLGSRVVNKLTEGFEGKNHKLFFDNFFNSVELMQSLKFRGIYAVGTVNVTRKFLPSFKTDRELKRGEFDWYTSDSKLFALKWKDKRSVHLLSNYHTPEDCTEVKRREKNGTVVEVPCPMALTDYNSNMNGVDKFDQLLSSYKIDRQSNKWWHRIFFYFLDACVINAYCMYKLLDRPDKETAKNFRRAIINGLVAPAIVSTSKRSNDTHPQIQIKKSKPFVPKEIRLNSSTHQPERASRRRCALCSTKAKPVRTDWTCNTCQVPLCLGKQKSCFQNYHC